MGDRIYNPLARQAKGDFKASESLLHGTVTSVSQDVIAPQATNPADNRNSKNDPADPPKRRFRLASTAALLLRMFRFWKQALKQSRALCLSNPEWPSRRKSLLDPVKKGSQAKQSRIALPLDAVRQTFDTAEGIDQSGSTERSSRALHVELGAFEGPRGEIRVADHEIDEAAGSPAVPFGAVMVLAELEQEPRFAEVADAIEFVLNQIRPA